MEIEITPARLQLMRDLNIVKDIKLCRACPYRVDAGRLPSAGSYCSILQYGHGDMYASRLDNCPQRGSLEEIGGVWRYWPI